VKWRRNAAAAKAVKCWRRRSENKAMQRRSACKAALWRAMALAMANIMAKNNASGGVAYHQ
jgi:hypothetical protein